MIDISKLSIEQLSKLASSILSTTGAIVLDIQKVHPSQKNVPRRNCYRKVEEKNGLMVKWGRIVKTMVFSTPEGMNKYIGKNLSKHTDVTNDEKV